MRKIVVHKWDIVGAGIFVLVFIVAFISYSIFRYCWSKLKSRLSRGKQQETPPTYMEKLAYEHYILGLLLVHPDDPYSKRLRLIVLALSVAMNIIVSAFRTRNCDASWEEILGIPDAQSICGMLLIAFGGSLMSSCIHLLLQVQCLLRRMRKGRFGCCSALLVSIILITAAAIIISLGSGCERRTFLIKLVAGLAITWFITQPIEIFIELKLWRNYEIYRPQYPAPTKSNPTKDDDDHELKEVGVGIEEKKKKTTKQKQKQKEEEEEARDAAPVGGMMTPDIMIDMDMDMNDDQFLDNEKLALREHEVVATTTTTTGGIRPSSSSTITC